MPLSAQEFSAGDVVGKSIPMLKVSAFLLVVFVATLVPVRAISAPLEAPWSLPALTAKPEALMQAAKAVAVSKDGDIETLFEEHKYRLDDRGGKQYSVRRIYRYLTEKGVEDSSCSETNWSSWCEDKPEFHVRVISPNGQVHALDPQSIGEAPLADDTPNLLSDEKLLRAPLPAIEVGAIVEEEIVSHQTRPFFDRGEVERILLADTNPLHKLRVTIDAPASVPLKYEVLGIKGLKPERTEADGRVQLVFETGPSPAREMPESYMPSDVCRWPQLVFSTGKSWHDVANAYSELVEHQLDVEAVRGLVHDTVGNETDRNKIITKLLAALRSQVRYTGVEFGKAAIVPRSPKETLGRRYGDCKDQATMLVAMLRVAGIPANVALLRTGQYFDVVPSLPGLGDFDHAIVYVPAEHPDEHPLWIDSTARCTLPGQLPISDQSRWAMVIDPKTEALIRTAKTDYRKNFSKEVFELFPSERGQGRLHVTITGSGTCDEDTREQYASDTPKNIRKVWREFLKDQYHTQTLGQIEYLAPLDLTKPFRVLIDVPDARVGQFDESRATVTLQPDLLFNRLPGVVRGLPDDAKEPDGGPPVNSSDDGGDDRKSPMELPEPHVRVIEFRIAPPPGFHAQSLPSNSSKQFGPATLSQKYAVADDGMIVATFTLDTGPGLLEADEVNALRDAIVELGKDEESPWEVKITLENPISKQFAAGNVVDALAAAGALVARHTAQAEYHAYQSQLLLKAGLGEAARREARVAIDLAPRSAAAFANLARVLTHDQLGQQFRAGMDWAGAAQAYTKALELEPGDVTNRMDYAILLEHNVLGVRYGAGARMDDAIAEYRKAQKQLGPRNRMEQLDLNAGLALLYSEKLADLLKMSTKLTKSDAWKGLAVCAIAAKEGVSAADRKAAQLARDGDDRRSILRTAADYADYARLYSQAAALLDMAAEGAADSNELREKAKALASQRRFSAADVESSGPQRAVQQLFLFIAGGGNELPSGLFAKGCSTQDMTTIVEELRRILLPALESARQSQIPQQRAIDMLSHVELRADGSAAEGWRVTAKDDNLKNVTWHVVTEDGAPKLAKAFVGSSGSRTESPGEPDQAGRLAAIYAEQGDAAKALENLRTSVTLQGGQINGADWYVLGRIAEDYRLKGEAMRLYGKISAPLHPLADDVYALAQRRLKKLQE